MRRSLFVAAPLLLASACTTVGPDFAAPVAPAVDRYAMAGDATPALPLTATARSDWWTIFGSPELDALVAQALAASPTLAAADATLARAAALESAVRGGAAPQLSANGSAARERINTSAFGIEGFPSPTTNLYSLGTRVRYDLDLFGGRRREVEQASAATEAAAHRADAAWLTLTGQVVTTAIELTAIEAELAELDEIIAVDRDTVAMIRRGVEAGGQPEAAINTAAAQLAEDEAQRPALLKRRDLTRHRLALLAGATPAGWSAPALALDDLILPAALPASLPSELVRARPDIRAAEADLHAATAAIGVAEAARYPAISIDAAFALTALDPGDLFGYDSSGWSVGPSLTAPLFNGGTLKARREAAEAAARAADARYRQTVLAAFAQVADQLAAIGHDQALVEAQARADAIARENARLAALAYDNGAGSLLSVIDAQRQARRARLAAIEARAMLRADIAALQVAAAAGRERDAAP